MNRQICWCLSSTNPSNHFTSPEKLRWNPQIAMSHEKTSSKQRRRRGPCYSSFQGLKELVNFTNEHWEISIQNGDTWYFALEKMEMFFHWKWGVPAPDEMLFRIRDWLGSLNKLLDLFWDSLNSLNLKGPHRGILMLADSLNPTATRISISKHQEVTLRVRQRWQGEIPTISKWCSH